MHYATYFPVNDTNRSHLTLVKIDGWDDCNDNSDESNETCGGGDDGNGGDVCPDVDLVEVFYFDDTVEGCAALGGLVGPAQCDAPEHYFNNECGCGCDGS